MPREVAIIDDKPVRYSIVRRSGAPFLFIRFRGPDGRRLEKSTKATSVKAVRDEVAAKIIADVYQEPERIEAARRREQDERMKAETARREEDERMMRLVGSILLVRKIDWHSFCKDYFAGTLRPGCEEGLSGKRDRLFKVQGLETMESIVLGNVLKKAHQLLIADQDAYAASDVLSAPWSGLAWWLAAIGVSRLDLLAQVYPIP